MTNLKEQYIKFGIKNWFVWDESKAFQFNWLIDWHLCKVNGVRLYNHQWGYTDFNFIELITSKDFITAIARWVKKELENGNRVLIWSDRLSPNYIRFSWGDIVKNLSWTIVNEQALSVYDWELDQFIKNILDIKD